jgi:membrane-associated phospholipid phosphatase
MIAKIDQLDKDLSTLVHNSYHSRFFDVFMLIFGSIYDPAIVPFTFIFVTILAEISAPPNPNRLLIPALYGLSFAPMFALSTILKRGFKRVRPWPSETGKKSKWLRTKQKNYSMPSGDSLQGWHLTTFCILHFHAWWMIPVGVLISYSRVHFVCHWIGDVIIGAIIGSLGCLIIQTILTLGLNNIEEQSLVKPFWI